MSEKNSVIEDFLEVLSHSMGGVPRSVAFEKQLCVMCPKDAKEFKNEISKREYKISGMCQVCQDNFFNKDQEEY